MGGATAAGCAAASCICMERTGADAFLCGMEGTASEQPRAARCIEDDGADAEAAAEEGGENADGGDTIGLPAILEDGVAEAASPEPAGVTVAAAVEMEGEFG